MSATIIKLPQLQKWQRDVYDAMENSRGSGHIYVVKSKRQVGKSIVAVCILIKFCLEQKCISVCVEPTQAQCRRVFKQVNDFLAGSGAIVSANATLLTIEFANGSELIFKSAEQGDNLRGTVCSGVLVIDEGSFIDDSVYELLYPITDAHGAPILCLSTPLFMEGEYFRLYSRGINGDERITSFDWAQYDTSIFLSKEKLEYYRNTISPMRFRCEYLGEFLSDNTGLLFTHISDNIEDNPEDTNIIYMGIDFGTGTANNEDSDYTSITTFNNKGQMLDIQRVNDLSPTQQIEWIAAIILKWAEHHTIRTILGEWNSIGSVYIDILNQKIRHKSLTITNWITSNQSKKELVDTFALSLEQGAVKLLGNSNLLKELALYACVVESSGNKVIYKYNASKGHDDLVMSTLISFWAYKKSLGNFRIAFA